MHVKTATQCIGVFIVSISARDMSGDFFVFETFNAIRYSTAYLHSNLFRRFQNINFEINQNCLVFEIDLLPSGWIPIWYLYTYKKIN